MECKGPHWAPGKRLDEKLSVLNRITVADKYSFAKDNLQSLGEVIIRISSKKEQNVQIIYPAKDNKEPDSFEKPEDRVSAYFEEIDEVLASNQLYLANAAEVNRTTVGVKYRGICDKVVDSISLTGDLYKEV